jgi:hypothetical protein
LINVIEELASVWALGKAMWKRNYTDVYKIIVSTQWSEGLKPLISSFAGINATSLVCCVVLNASITPRVMSG